MSSSAEETYVISVIMPAYNEENIIKTAVEDIINHIFVKIPDSEIIIIDDGSKDKTGEIVDALSKHNPRIKVFHQKNAGHGPALYKGLQHAKGDYLFLIDSDRQIPIEAFDKLWSEIKNNDAVFGVRSERKDPWVRIFISKILHNIIKLLFNVTLKDANVPFKLLKKEMWDSASKIIPPTSFVPSLLLAIFLKKKFTLKEINVPHRKRMTGTTTLRKWKLLKFSVHVLLEVISFRRKIKNDT